MSSYQNQIKSEMPTNESILKIKEMQIKTFTNKLNLIREKKKKQITDTELNKLIREEEKLQEILIKLKNNH